MGQFSSKQSIKLMLAKGKGTTVLATGIADAIIKIPGTFGVDAQGDLLAGRTIEGGGASFGTLDFGDYVTAEVRDDDNLLGFGAGTVLDTFQDLGVPSGGEGWYFLGRPIELHPVISDDPTDLPAGMYLHVIGVKGLALPLGVAHDLYVNIHWGVRIR